MLALLLLDQQAKALNDNVSMLTTFTILDKQVTVLTFANLQKQPRVQLWIAV